VQKIIAENGSGVPDCRSATESNALPEAVLLASGVAGALSYPLLFLIV